MPHFDAVVTVSSVNEGDLKKLEQEYGIGRVTLQARYSYNGEIIPAESFSDIDRMNEDEKFAFNCLMNANRRD